MIQVVGQHQTCGRLDATTSVRSSYPCLQLGGAVPPCMQVPALQVFHAGQFAALFYTAVFTTACFCGQPLRWLSSQIPTPWCAGEFWLTEPGRRLQGGAIHSCGLHAERGKHKYKQIYRCCADLFVIEVPTALEYGARAQPGCAKMQPLRLPRRHLVLLSE